MSSPPYSLSRDASFEVAHDTGDSPPPHTPTRAQTERLRDSAVEGKIQWQRCYTSLNHELNMELVGFFFSCRRSCVLYDMTSTPSLTALILTHTCLLTTD